MLDSIYHNGIEITLKSHFWRKDVIIHRNLSQTLRIEKVGLYLLLKRRTVTVVVEVPYMTNQNSRKTQLI